MDRWIRIVIAHAMETHKFYAAKDFMGDSELTEVFQAFLPMTTPDDVYTAMSVLVIHY